MCFLTTSTAWIWANRALVRRAGAHKRRHGVLCVLFAGDVAMRRYPRLASPSSGVAVWLEALAPLQRLDVDVVVPSHGPLGDATLIDAYEEYFATIQSRVGELNSQGLSADEIVERLTGELAPRFSDWQEDGAAIIDSTVRTAIAEVP